MKISNCFLVVGTVLAVAACTTVRPMPLPDGTMSYALECSGTSQTADDCYAQVARLCPQGSEIVTASHISVMTFDPFERALYVRCTKPAS